jgi:membrane protein required for colicin V production
MNWLDIVFAAILIGSVIGAATTGFSRSIIGFVSLILGVVCGLWFYGTAGAYLAPYMSHRGFANVIGFFIVFVVFLVAGGLLSAILQKVVKATGLTWVDRFLGAGFGLVRAAVVCIVIVLVLSAFSPKPPPESIVNSRIAPYVMAAANIMSSMAPREVKDGFRESYEKARQVWAGAVQNHPLPELPSHEI